MLVTVDQEGAQAVAAVCDALLKGAGLRCLQQVNKVMANMKLVEAPKTSSPPFQT